MDVLNYVARESLADLARTCHDVANGRGSVAYGIPSLEQQHKNELPADGVSHPWPLWKSVAEVIQCRASADIRQEQLTPIIYAALEQGGAQLTPEYRDRTRDMLHRLATFAIHRAKLIS